MLGYFNWCFCCFMAAWETFFLGKSLKQIEISTWIKKVSPGGTAWMADGLAHSSGCYCCLNVDDKYRPKKKNLSNFCLPAEQKIAGWYRIEIVNLRHTWIWNCKGPLTGLGKQFHSKSKQSELQLYNYVWIWGFFLPVIFCLASEQFGS